MLNRPDELFAFPSVNVARDGLLEESIDALRQIAARREVSGGSCHGC
jgi:hypothetical protein